MGEETVYAIASGKGGVGKTTTTVNLGTALAKAGERVAIVDVDLGMANLARFVSAGGADVTLHEVLAGEATVQEATHPLAGDLYALPSGSDLGTYSEVSTERLGEVVDDLRSAFDYVLLDVGAGVSHETILPLGLADEVVLVSTVDPAAIDNTQKSVELVERAGSDIAGIVLTRAREDDDADAPAIGRRFPGGLLATIPEDEAVRKSIRAGRPVVVESPDAPAAKAYLGLAKKLLGEDDATGAAGAPADGTDDGDDEEEDDDRPSLDLDLDIDTDT